MKPILLFLLFIICVLAASAQVPEIEWQNTIGGSGNDELHSIQQTADGGYILGGRSNSGISGDKTEANMGSDFDYWVVKLDVAGNIVWQNTIGGSGGDYLNSIQQTTDGGYIVGGYSGSGISGDKTEASLGGIDYWVIKLDTAGNIVWQNTIGGENTITGLTDIEVLSSIQQTADGGYILGGLSNSGISGDKTEASQGFTDYWVIKLDAAGNIVWQNTIGGNSNDNLNSIQQTADLGYILGGNSSSGISGDKTEAVSGLNDYWVVKLDAAGSILWENTIGGNDNDLLQSIEQTADGGYILGGSSNSLRSGDKSENTFGGTCGVFITYYCFDYWVVKIDSSGNIQWDNTIGGSDAETLNSIQQTADGGYILGGHSISGISGDKTENSQGGSDYWAIKLNPAGNIVWQNTIGGSGNEELWSMQQTADGGYILGGSSGSGISGDKTEPAQNTPGSYDYWVIKLRDLHNISGQLLTETGIPIPGVTVMLSGDDTLTATTDTTGRYSFTVRPNGNYTITPSKSNDVIVNNGITSIDILLMWRTSWAPYR